MSARDPIRLSVFDLDGTLVDGDSHAALLRALALDRAVPARVRAEIVFGGLSWALGRRDNGWTKSVAARALAGRPVDVLLRFGEERVLPRVRPALAARVRSDREEGFVTLMLSASLEPAITPVARALGFDFVAGTRLSLARGVIVGHLDGDALHGPAKANFLDRFACEHGAELARSRGYGDSHADRWFLERLGEPCAVAPDRRLGRLARARGWAILDP